MRPFRDMRPLSVGLVGLALIATAVTVAFAYGVAGIGEHRYVMSGAFEESAGIEAGADVRVAGIVVGEVTGVDVDRPRGQVVVTWEVDDEVDLGPATTADVRLANLLGGQYIALAGPVEPPFVADAPVDERRVPIERTSVPFPISETLGDTADLVAGIDADATNDLVSELRDVTDGAGPQLEAVLDGLTRVGATLTEREATVGSLLDHTEALSRTLASKDAALAALITSSQALLDEVVARRDELAQLLGSGAAVQSLTGVIDRNRADLDALLGDLQGALEVLDDQQGAVQETLTLLGPTVTGVAATNGGHGPFQDATFLALGPDVFAILAQAYPAYGVEDTLGQAGFGPFLEAMGAAAG